jgi:hypothetical protein
MPLNSVELRSVRTSSESSLMLPRADNCFGECDESYACGSEQGNAGFVRDRGHKSFRGINAIFNVFRN